MAECNLLHRYNKNRGYGCDDEHSLEFAFEEMQERIEAYKNNAGTMEG